MDEPCTSALHLRPQSELRVSRTPWTSEILDDTVSEEEDEAGIVFIGCRLERKIVFLKWRNILTKCGIALIPSISQRISGKLRAGDFGDNNEH